MENSHTNGSLYSQSAQNSDSQSSHLRTYSTSVRPASSPQISVEEFVEQTNENQRAELARAISSAVLFFIERERAVFLEGLGILFPVANESSVSRVAGSHFIIRQETTKSLQIEKCTEITANARKRFSQLVDTHELASAAHPLLPFSVNLHWNERTTRRNVRGLCKFIAHTVITDGSCDILQPLGVFYALHNRQGTLMRDRFAGADVFMTPTYSAVKKVGDVTWYERPHLANGWEPFEAIFGAPKQILKIDPIAELKKLGLVSQDSETIPKLHNPDFDVAVFERPSEGGDKSRILVYCSDGLRRYGMISNCGVGTEFVFQVAVDAEIPNSGISSEWPKRVFTKAWTLLQSSKNRTAAPGISLSFNAPLNDFSQLTGIFTTPCTLLKHEALCSGGAFQYVGLVGITQAEASLIHAGRPHYLQALLERKELDQVTRLGRPSLVSE